jgi:hypothetical protein
VIFLQVYLLPFETCPQCLKQGFSSRKFSCHKYLLEVDFAGSQTTMASLTIILTKKPYQSMSCIKANILFCLKKTLILTFVPILLTTPSFASTSDPSERDSERSYPEGSPTGSNAAASQIFQNGNGMYTKLLFVMKDGKVIEFYAYELINTARRIMEEQSAAAYETVVIPNNLITKTYVDNLDKKFKSLDEQEIIGGKFDAQLIFPLCTMDLDNIKKMDVRRKTTPR